jgi:dihydroorotate dehydrogenase (fumarate)
MDEHGYEAVGDFRGKMSQKKIDDPLAFERAQYVRLLMGLK